MASERKISSAMPNPSAAMLSARPVAAPSAVQPNPHAKAAADQVMAPLARPQAIKIPAGISAKKTAPAPSYLEMVEQLEPLIQKQLAEVKAVMDQRGLGPDDVQMVSALDITGREVSVCLACGVIGHDYQPTIVRQENPEIDMFVEKIVVDLEVASRLGIALGLLAYDDEGVLKLRDVNPPSSSADRAKITERFQAFRKRHTAPNVTDPKWIAEERERWVPSDATRKVKGEPDDRLCLDTAQKMLAKTGRESRVRGVTIAKSQVPAQSLKGLEAVMKGKGIQLSGTAVGQEAANVARAMFAKTSIAPTMHDLREHTGKAMAALVAQAKDAP